MNKIILLFFIGTIPIFSQTIKVRGVVLTYDKVKKTMTLTTTPKINVNLNIFGEPEQSLKTSLWELLAKKLDAPPAKFKAFITLIEQASLMNA